MTPKVERHVAAIVDLLRDGLPDNVSVDLTDAASGARPPYLVVHPDAGDVARDRLCGERANLVLRFELEAVGAGAEQALWVLDTARALVLGVRPTVAGRTCAPVTQIDGSTLFRADALQPPTYVIDAVFRLFSQPAAQPAPVPVD